MPRAHGPDTGSDSEVAGNPRRVYCDVLRRTEQVIGFEDDIKGWADAGDSPSEIVKRGGYF